MSPKADLAAGIAAARARFPVKAVREQVGETMIALARENPDFLVLTADLMFATGLGRFGDLFPERLINLGIAEQNLAGVASGLALCGKLPVVSCYAAFTSLRGIEQLKLDVAYNGVKAIFAAQSAGLSYGVGGPTHQTYEDLAIMRAIPNVVVLSPADPNEVDACLRATLDAEIRAPIYIRLGRGPEAVFTPPNRPFEIGRATTLREGRDVSLIATGAMVFEALLAAEALAVRGIEAGVLNLGTVKPLDEAAVRAAVRETSALVVAEEHGTRGGLGAAVLEALAETGAPPTRLIGVPDLFPPIGPPTALRAHLGLDAERLAVAALDLLSGQASQGRDHAT